MSDEDTSKKPDPKEDTQKENTLDEENKSKQKILPDPDEKASDESVTKKLDLESEKQPESSWPQFKDESLSSAASVIEKSGMSYEDAQKLFEAAAKSNNIDDVDLVGLEAKLGKEQAALVMLGVKDYYTRNLAEVKKTTEEVHKVFGGEEQYNTVKTWALEQVKTNETFAADFEQYKEMFNAGGVSARAAALDMLQQYTTDPETSGLEVKMIDGTKTVHAVSGLTPINRKDYVDLLEKAHAKNDQKEIQQLHAQRKLGMNQGLN